MQIVGSLSHHHLLPVSRKFRVPWFHAMGSPVSPVVANLNMEEVERKAIESFRGTPQNHLFWYVDDTRVKKKNP